MVVVGTIKGNGSGVIKPVTRFKPAHNFIICGARSLFTKDVNTILPGYFVVFGSQQAMRCENFIPSFFFTLPSIFFSFSNNSLSSDPLLSDSRDVSHYKRVCLGCHTPGSWSGNCEKPVWTPPSHPESTCYQMLILIWLRPTFLGRTSSDFCFWKPPLHFHHRPVLTH